MNHIAHNGYGCSSISSPRVIRSEQHEYVVITTPFSDDGCFFHVLLNHRYKYVVSVLVHGLARARRLNRTPIKDKPNVHQLNYS